MFKLKPLVLSLLLAGGLSTSTVADESSDLTAADTNTQIQTLVQEADSLITQNYYQDAIGLLSEAYALAGHPENSEIARNVLNSLANLYYNTGQLEAASRYYQELVDIDEAADDIQGLSISLFNLAHATASRQLFTEADRYFRRSLLLSQQISDDEGSAFTMKAMGVNAQAMGNLESAETLLLAARDKFSELRNTQQMAAVLRNLGDLKLEKSQAHEAVTFYLEAMPILAKNSFNTALLRTYRGLSLAYERLGQLDKALISQRAYTDLMKFELEQQSEDSTQRMQVEFETQRYADDNARLHAIRIQQELQLEESKQLVRLQFLVLALGTGMLSLVLLMLYRSRMTAKRMHQLAITDELTKMLNRRAIMSRGKEEWIRAARFHHPLSCLMFDIDNFKSINDTLGHATGDEVLRTVAVILGDLLRKTDFVGRVGGEEFLLIAPETDRKQSIALAERIRIGIQNASIPGIVDRQVTVSIGVAGLNREASIEQLIQHADQALYTAKESGRNRCIIYQERKDPPRDNNHKDNIGMQPAY